MVLRQDLISALDSVSYDKNVVLGMIDKHPDMIKMLSETKDKEGKPLFDALDIDDILFNCKDTIEQHPDKITAVLNNPEEINIISSYKSKGAGLWRAVGDPLNSTIERNPEAFGIKAETKQENKESISNTDSTIKSFSEYFAGYKNYDNGGELDQMIIADAKKVFETLKTPEAIQSFHKADYKTQQKMVSGLDDGHSGFSFGCVCQCAYNYAEYKTKEQPYTFDEYFAGYKNYDNGGELDQMIIADAKKVFETLKTPEAIQSFHKADYKTQQKMVSGLDDGHSGFSFGCVCQCAYNYSAYAQKYIKDSLNGINKNIKEQSKTNEEQNTTNRLAAARKRLAGKIDEKSGTNLQDIKLPKKIKDIEAKISKHFDKSGR